ncbi:MAG: lipopolysaccharide biosynthesis protein [Planctomycetia bacterium]|nr:lipopolysaccharide biosynthesis protein [Planctomycetia bacterium]
MRQTDRLIINVLSNYGLTVVAGIASLIVVPIVVNDLTQTGYGLAMMLLSGITVTTTLGNAVNRAMQRYLPQDLESADAERVNGTFNSAMAMFGMLGLLAAITILLLRDWYLDDPGITPELRADGNMAFFIVAIFMLVEGPLLTFQAGLEAIQRFDLVGAYTGATTVLRMLAIIAFFKLGAGSIVVFALSHMVAMILASVMFFICLKRAIPKLEFSVRHIRLDRFKILLVFAAAGLVMTVGNVLGQEGFRVLVGKGLSMADVGGLSAVWAFRSMVFMVICSMTNVLTPTASALEARGSAEALGKLLVASTKYSSVAAASMCLVPLAVFGPFLRLWLGEEFASLTTLLIVIMLAQLPISASLSAQQMLIGLGRLRITSPAVFSRGAVSLVVAGLYMYFSEEPSLTGAAVWLYAIQVFFSLVVFVHGSREIGVGVRRLILEGMALPAALGAASALLTWVVSSQIGTGDWLRILGAVGIGEVVFLGLIIALGLGVEERAHLGSFMSRVKARVMPNVSRS